MNAKLAKQLRKIARQVATEDLQYVSSDPQRQIGFQATDGGYVTNGFITGTLTVNERSVRGVYRQLKKAARARK